MSEASRGGRGEEGRRSGALVCGQQASDVAGLFLAQFSVTLDLSAGGEKIKSRESDRGTHSFKMLSNKLCQTYQSREAPAATTQPTCIECILLLICN